MYWTVPSAIFVIGIFGAIIFLSVLGVLKPNIDRKGFLPIETGRGDRLFIAVYSSIIFLLLWLGILGNVLLVIPAVVIAIWFFCVCMWG